ncbi:MAG: thioredoxin domain-containing protein [Planctomycetota bacterium]|jgi:protein-disulfide isomerase
MKKSYQHLGPKALKLRRFASISLLLATLAFCGCTFLDRNSAPTPGGANTEPIEGPALEIERTVVDLGRIPADRNEIVGEVRISNPGNEPLQIRDISGADTSFAGFTGTRFLSPGQQGKLQIKFDPAKIPTGPTRRRATVQTNDPKRPRTQVYFRFDLRRNATEEQIWILRTELSALREDVRGLRRDLDGLARTVRSAKAAPRQEQKPPATAACDVAVASSPVLGPNDAPVTIVEFVDFQCPYCIREWPKVKRILKEYPGRVRVVFKHFPLRFHTKARPAHAAAELAHRQGGAELFWKMHDMIIAQPKKLDIADLRQHASALNMKLTTFDQVMADANKITELLSADLAEARKCGVRGTPTVLINGVKLTNRTYSNYRSRVEQILTARKE